MRKIISIFFYFLTFQLLAEEIPKYNTLISQAENLSYNFEFDSCNVILDEAIRISSDRPEAYLLNSKNHLWFFLGSKDPVDYTSFMNYTDSALSKTEILLDENDEDASLLYLLGNIYKYRAMAYGTNRNTLDAFWATKKSVSFYEDVLEIDSSFYSAYGGIGIFEYALSYVPALFNWALAISGLSADQMNGFKLLESAVQKGIYDNIEYKFHLSKLYDEHLAEYEDSKNLLNTLLEEYPQNPLFHYQLAIECIKLRELDEAINELEIVLEIAHPKFVQINSFSNFLIGDIYYRKRDYKKALEYYHLFLRTTKTIDYTGIASLRTAYCYYLTGDTAKFKRYALLSSNGNLDLEDDKFAQQMGLYVLENGFSNDRKILTEIENSYLAKDEDSALVIINDNIDSIKVEEIKAQVLLYKSKILINSGEYVLANDVLSGIDTLTIDTENWIVPMTLYNIAQIKYFNLEFDKSLEYLELAEDNNDSQKKNIINSYINGLRRKISKIN